ncbi:hypothetical protein O7632_11905 [Solwaraspora sp. WMMD406]|uniref:hypothetical protein n=1 Tax=Solwaraspora sp. WMMD406 TaxID=3016095 RepID=UPI0024161561|nr:hypothetical protein [Solwaraspora sp. WMMD406]MDG4764797.1 hypothetical protein [Solwaraspora sp. WMMD406]
MVDDMFGGRRAPDREPIDVTPLPAATRPDADHDDRPARRRRTIAVAAVAAAGLVGAGLIGIPAWRVLQQSDAALSAPAEAAGLLRDDSEQASATADYLNTAFAAGIALDRSIGVVYADPNAEDRAVLLVGGTTLLWSPERDLDTMLALVGDDQGTVSGVHQVPAGRLGGVMKCGTTPVDDTQMPVCGWADHGSIAVALFPQRGVDESAALLVELRDAIQQRD